MEKKLKIAVQKSGRLNEGSLKLLKECGISIASGTNQLKTHARNFPIEILYLRNSDIPQYVEDGVVDIAMIGENTHIEKERDIEVIEKLGFSRCRLSLAVPKDVEYPGIQYFEGKQLATSYPNTLNAFLKEKGVSAEIHVISGSVEIAPGIGLADGVCDLVSSGSTLFMNGLREVEEVMTSEAVIVSAKNLDPELQQILDDLLFRLRSVLKAKKNKYVLLNAPNHQLNEIISLLPGMRSPTVLPLAEEGWSSVHSVIDEKTFWNNIDSLKKAGAEGILVVPIEKMIL